VTTPKIIDQIHELILEARHISAKSIAEQLGIHEDLDMRKLSAKWVPKCLNADQKHQRCQSSEQLLEFFRRWKSSHLDFLGPRRHPPHWLSSKGPNYQRGVLLISSGATDGHFEGERRGKFSKGVLFLHDNTPAHRALATQKKMAYLGFQCLDHPPYSPDLAPSDYHLFPGLTNQV